MQPQYCCMFNLVFRYIHALAVISTCFVLSAVVGILTFFFSSAKRSHIVVSFHAAVITDPSEEPAPSLPTG